MGVVFSGMFGLGLVMYVAIQTEVHLDHILFGNVLGVTWADVAETAIISSDLYSRPGGLAQGPVAARV